METILSPGSLPGEVWSHPHRPLAEHLEGVAALAFGMRERHRVPVEEEQLRAVTLTHDLAKRDPRFQRYIRGEGQGTPHACPSARFALDLTGDLLSAEVVCRHHTVVKEFGEAVAQWFGDHACYEKYVAAIRGLDPQWPLRLAEGEWRRLQSELLLNGETDEHQWLRHRALLSLLIAADRMDAVGLRELPEERLPRFTPLHYSGDSALNEWRSGIRSQCLRKAEEIDRPGIYTITLPTGAGKTSTGLEAATRVAGATGAAAIVYALPFISIVEQNAGVAADHFGEAIQEDHSRAALKEERDEGATSQSPLRHMVSFFRSWNAPVTVTTLAKLWSVLFGAKANESINFHRLANAVVILDEPQGIRPELWGGLGRVMEHLTERFGTTFLLMTATQPEIAKGRAVELAPEGVALPASRHRYSVYPERLPLEDLAPLLEERTGFPDQSGMVVLNTRRAALEAYRMLAGQLPEDMTPFFLSTFVTPRERRDILERLRKREREGADRLLVATQVVEAGVDLDFPWVFRDLGPLDSVVQVAGRCNRHGGPDPGTVAVAELVSERNAPYATQVYSATLVDATRQTLRDTPAFDERQVPELIGEYYRQVAERIRQDSPWEAIVSGKWDALPPLYEDKPYSEEAVLVEIDDGLRPLLNRLREGQWSLENLMEKKRLQARLSDYTINVPEKTLQRMRQVAGGITAEEEPLQALEDLGMWLLTGEAVTEAQKPGETEEAGKTALYRRRAGLVLDCEPSVDDSIF
ncbi:MAG: CRISPR-associated helicase Cas3' [Synergistales bacterium]|nr:CRISPR-associated helicase Cas3' [Synergistales bacterium]